MFFKGEKSVRFVQQNIGIEDVNLSIGRIFFLASFTPVNKARLDVLFIYERTR